MFARTKASTNETNHSREGRPGHTLRASVSVRGEEERRDPVPRTTSMQTPTCSACNRLTAVSCHRAHQRTAPSRGTLAYCSMSLLAIAAGFSTNGPLPCRPSRGRVPLVQHRRPGVDHSGFTTSAPASPIMIVRDTRIAVRGSPSVLAMSPTFQNSGGGDGSFGGDAKPGPVARLLRVPTRGIKEFWQGASYVHNNYLDLWREISLRNLKCLSPFMALFVAGIVSNGSAISGHTAGAWIPLLSENVRSILERTLMFVRVPTRYVMMSLCFPYLLALVSTMSGVKRQPIRGSATWLFKRTFLPRIDQAPHDFSTSNRKCFALYTTVGLLVPLLEELAIRFTFWKLWKGVEDFVRKKRTSPQNESDTKDKAKRRNLPTLWLLTSSLIFAGVHIGNHLPTPSAVEVENLLSVEEKAEFVRSLSEEFPEHNSAFFESIPNQLADLTSRFAPVLRAMSHLIVAFTLSTEVFCPQFLSGWIMASFGAHAAWNTLTGYFLLNFFLRLVVRLIRVILGMGRKKTDKCQERTEQNRTQWNTMIIRLVK